MRYLKVRRALEIKLSYIVSTKVLTVARVRCQGTPDLLHRAYHVLSLS